MEEYVGPSLFGWIIIGIVAGWIAEQVMKTNMGLLMNFVVGIVGAFLGGIIFAILPFVDDDGGFIWSLLVATVGAIALLWIVNKVRGRRPVV